MEAVYQEVLTKEEWGPRIIKFIEAEEEIILGTDRGISSIKYGGKLRPVTVKRSIAWLIDELPALAIAMAEASGTSVVRNAKELRVKESDRISSVLKGLNSCGVETVEYEDGYEIVGGELQMAKVDSHGDHRVAMSLNTSGPVVP